VLDRDHDRPAGTAAERDSYPLPGRDASLELGRNAIREGAGNWKIGDDVRAQEGGP